jgi:hypothetical protein
MGKTIKAVAQSSLTGGGADSSIYATHHYVDSVGGSITNVGDGDTLLTSVDVTTMGVKSLKAGKGTDFTITDTTITINSYTKTLDVKYSDASNVSTAETDLLSYTLPANTLKNTGDRVVIEALFTTPSNGNSKSLKFYFGGANIDWTSSTIANGATIFMRITIFKTGSNAQRMQIERITGYSDFPVYSTSTETDTGTIVIKFAGTGTASNDITQRTMTTTYYPK